MRVAALIFLLMAPALGLQASPLETAWELADQARQAARDGSLEQGLAFYREALELSPESMEIRRDYAVVLGWSGDFESAGREFSRVIALSPEQPPWAMREIARAELETGDAASALDWFNQLSAAGDGDESVVLGRAEALRQLGDASAEQAFRDAIDLFPDAAAARSGLMTVLIANGAFDEVPAVENDWRLDHGPDADIERLASTVALLVASPRYVFDVVRTAPRPASASPQLPAGTWSSTTLSPSPERWKHTRRALAVELADIAVRFGREGEHWQALALYETCLEFAPENLSIRRDYAIVLGWADEYDESRKQFAAVVETEPEQPAWFWKEYARSNLFGDHPKDALPILNRLIEEGDESSSTLGQKALALRWLNRSGDAKEVYKTLAKLYPEVSLGAAGMVSALADQDRLWHAVRFADRSLERFPNDIDLLKRKGQALNWSGRHFAAERVFAMIPDEHALDSEVIQGKAVAARWGADPLRAKEYSRDFQNLYPDSRDARRLHRDLSLEYGYSFDTSFRLIWDNLGLRDRTWAQRFQFHVNPAHGFYVGHDYRKFDDAGGRSWNSYQAGWNGKLDRRLVGSASISNVRYGGGFAKWVGEGSVQWLASDRVRVSGSGGRIAMDTPLSAQNGITASFLSGDVVFKPTHKTRLDAGYASFFFSDRVRRDRWAFSALHKVYHHSRLKLELGGRANLNYHDGASRNYYSPQYFYTYLGVLRAEGRIISDWDYVLTVGTGWQREPGIEWQHPLNFDLKMTKRLSPYLRLFMEYGRSQSSIDRLRPDQFNYVFSYFMGYLQFQMQ